jgi:hypothetical protein
MERLAAISRRKAPSWSGAVACSRIYLHECPSARDRCGRESFNRPTSRPRNASAPNNAPRSRQRRRAFKCAGLPLLATETHILPVMVGDPELRKRASDLLLEQHGIYIQPINYPTVPGATVRLRITATPGNGPRLIVQLTEALVSVWKELRLKLGECYEPSIRRARTVAAGG